MSFGNRNIGIDLGTKNTLVYENGKIVLDQPSVIAYDKSKKKAIAVGNEAKAMLGKTSANIEVVEPLKEGVVIDFNMASEMIKFFFAKILKKITAFSKIRMAIGVPSGINDIEKRAVKSLAKNMGAKEIYILDEPFAAAIGMGAPVKESVATMVVDVGGGTTDVAVIANSDIVVKKSIRFAGNNLDMAIIDYLKEKKNLLIGPITAEMIKINLGVVFIDEELYNNPISFDVKGKNIVSGLPTSLTLTYTDIYDALEESMQKIISIIKNVLGMTPPELAVDIEENGIILTGGGSMLIGFDKLILRETGLKSFIPENPKELVCLGMGMCLTDKSISKILEAHG